MNVNVSNETHVTYEKLLILIHPLSVHTDKLLGLFFSYVASTSHRYFDTKKKTVVNNILKTNSWQAQKKVYKRVFG